MLTSMPSQLEESCQTSVKDSVSQFVDQDLETGLTLFCVEGCLGCRG